MTSGSYKKILIFARIVFITVVILGIGWLIQQDIVISGAFEAETDFQQPSPFITEIVPLQRTILSAVGVQIKSEPVYTSLKYPRPFKTVDITLAFENPDDLFVEFGPQVLAAESYQLEVVNHPTLNKLAYKDQNWEQAGDSRLYQKRSAEYNYITEDQFFEGLPDKQITGYYGVDWQRPYTPPASDLKETLLIDTPLRGGHEFYLVTQSNDLDLQLNFQDINIVAGADPVEVTLLDWEGDELEQWSFSDDGDIRERGGTSELRSETLQLVGLEASMVYLLKFNATDDIILHQIGGNISHLVAKGRLHLAGGPDYVSEFGTGKIKTTEVITNARQWSAVTSHRDTLQELRMASERLVLSEPLKEARFSLSPDRRFLLDKGYQVFVEKGNIVLTGRGVFALKPAYYFSPTPWLIDQTTDPEVLGLSYLFTDYLPPVAEPDGSFTKTIQTDLTEVFNPEKQLRYQLSIPDLKPDKSFTLRSLRASFKSEPVTLSNFTEKLGRFIDREILTR